jgi:heat-inducible transcriptional repressor
MLTDRRERLLRFIVDEYVRTAQPVASAAIVERYGLPVSSATIRNEMAKLEEEGYIVQRHTSAGRIPSDRGYRYYVETLMRPQEPPATVQQTIRHQFHQAAGETDEWAHLAAAVLAARLSYVSVVTPPQAVRPRLRSLQLVSVHDFAALLVVVLQETQVLQQTIRLERPASQDELNEIAARLNTLYGGRTADEIRASQSEHLSLDGDVLGVALDLIESAEVDAFGEASLEGLREMLREPEFAAGDSMLSLLDLLERSNLPKAIPLARVGEHEIVAVIGSEHPQDAMRQCSVVISRYAGASGLRGTISVVGPTRMHYPRAVSLVRYMSALMEELLDAYFG